MRVGFAGTPAFAATALAALLDAGFAVPLVLTQPDRPQGRGMRLVPPPVKTLAQERGLPVLQPATLRTDEGRAAALAVPLDVLVVAAYGLILPPPVLGWPRHGCLNIHASLLPRWRGAAPIQRALLEGDAETGVTIMQLDAGLDTGPTVDAVRVPIASHETAGTLTEKLAVVGAAAMVATLRRLAGDGALVTAKQPAAGATYAAKIERADAAIDWRAGAVRIDRQIRAFNPAPGAYSSLGGEPVKLWRAEPRAEEAAGAPPGTIIAVTGGAFTVATGDGVLRVAELQPAGGRRMTAPAFVAGRRLVAGARFDATPS